jgi:ParB/RepB/Spo0J family partition protein
MSLDVAGTPAFAKIAANVREIPHNQLRPSELNPRKHARSDAEIDELAQSIADKGVLQNLVARPMIGVATDDGRQIYEIAAGEGRWRAVGMLLERGAYDPEGHMPVSVRELGDEDMIEIGLIENMQRKDLTPLEEGRAFMALHTAAFKRGGKKAAGAAVKRIAERIRKTERFVEKRIALARDLAPEAAELFDDGKIDLAAAQLLAAVPVKQQTRLIADHEKSNADHAKWGRDDDIAPMSADDIAQELNRDIRDMAHAHFDHKLYDGPTLEHRGRTFATDKVMFDKLQKEAIAEITRTARQQAKDGDIAFLEEGNYFPTSKYDQDKDPAGGVFIERDYSGRVRIFRGLVKSKSAIAEEKRAEQWKAEDAKRRANAKGGKKAKSKTAAEPRIEQVFKFCATSPVALLALELCSWINGYRKAVDWFCMGGDPSAGRLALEALEKTGKVPVGDKLLAWLLEQKLQTLALAWAAGRSDEASDAFIIDWRRPANGKVSAAEKAIFDYCGAEVPAPEASAVEIKGKILVKTAGRSKKRGGK